MKHFYAPCVGEVEKFTKLKELLELDTNALTLDNKHQTVVFCNSALKATDVAEAIRNEFGDDWAKKMAHETADMTDTEMRGLLTQFREGKFRLLVTSDAPFHLAAMD